MPKTRRSTPSDSTLPGRRLEKQLGIRVTPELNERLEKIAAAELSTVSHVIRRLVISALKHEEW